MFILLGVLCVIISTFFGFMVGWGMAVKFKTFYNYINYLRGCEEWKTKPQYDRFDVVVYSNSITEAKAIARIHESIIENAETH